MRKYEVITSVGIVEITADLLQIIITDLHFTRNGHKIAIFNGDKIYGWVDRTGEGDETDDATD